MAYNILGVNLSHNSSIALVSNGKLEFYLEEERLSRKKRDENPYFLLKKYLKKFTIDEIVFSGTSINHNDIVDLLIKSLPFNIKWSIFFENHHLTHAYCAFINSGFKEANNIVIDFGGSIPYLDNTISESESIFYLTQNSFTDKKIYKSYNSIFTTEGGISKTYSSVGSLFGIDVFDGGKLMGLSSYGKKTNYLPSFFINEKGNIKLFAHFSHQAAGVLKNDLFPKNFLKIKKEIKDKKLSQLGKDIAYKIQQEAQEEVAKLVEKSLQINNCKNITLSGGFGLNCVNNYFLKKKFPNINFYFEPISHDGGTAIGAAYARFKELNPNYSLTLQNSLYLGPQYSKEKLLEGIQKYV
jgi:carbamoyltransferase